MLKPNGLLVIHTAPNVWYDRYAYPFVRLFRTLNGEGAKYPANPRLLNVAINADVHVNEQSGLSLWRAVRAAGFTPKKFGSTARRKIATEGKLLATLRKFLFEAPPFRWFFEREVFTVAKNNRHLLSAICHPLSAMKDRRPVDELSVEELEQILAIKREEREARLRKFRASGRAGSASVIEIGDAASRSQTKIVGDATL